MVGYYPETIEEALTFRKEHENTVLFSGGTDLMVRKQLGNAIIFINQISELKKIKETEDSIFIGAGVTYTQALEASEIPHLLKQALVEVASPAIRNQGTIVGNICNASPAGDTLPVLYVIDTVVVVGKKSGAGYSEKEIIIEEFIQGVRKIQLSQDEMVIGIKINKKLVENSSYCLFKKVGARKAEAISKLSFAGRIYEEDGKIVEVAFAFGSVGVTVVRNKEYENTLVGMTITELKMKKEEIVNAYSQWIHPIDDQRSTKEYRKTVCLNIVRGFLEEMP